METERHHLSSSTTPAFATDRNNGCLIDSGRVPRPRRPPSLVDSSSSGSTQDLNMMENIKRHNIPTIEISDPGVDRSPETSPRFGLYGRSSPNRHAREGFSGSKLAALKKKTYHVLSFGHDKDDDKDGDHGDGLLRAVTDLPGFSSGKRRAVSMPLPNFQKQAQMDILHHHTDPVATRSYLASGSPPIVDFTRFEDRYRSPSNDYDSLFSVSKGKKVDSERKATSHFSSSRSGKPGNVFANETWTAKQGSYTENGCGNSGRVGVDEMVRNSSRDVLYPANERKPDPRLILDALENASETFDIQGLLNVDDLLMAYDVDQGDFELRAREGQTGRKSRAGNARTVFGESIQNVFRYASTTIVLGEREYVLPIVVLHCVEEIYRTGIYQSNLFRTLPNRPRLHELISIFDSEEQPPGSIIRSRRSSPSNLEGFGAATSLHLESTPDICALLASYLSALPEPILPRNLFEAVWKLCEVDKRPHDDFPEPRPAPITSPDPSAPVRLSSVALARSYTPRCEATYILIAQLLLHLLPSPHFFLFVYLLSFFSQVALVREENGVGIEDLSKMFGARIFGHGNDTKSSSISDLQSPSKSSKGKGKEKERNGRGEVMMVWFLRRWGPFAETLFEVVDDAKLGVLHRNKLMRKDSLGKDTMTSAYTAACEALSAHDAVESEMADEQEDGERYDEVENMVERELLDDGDVSGNVDLPEPVNVVGSPPTVHVPIAVDSQKLGIPPPVTFARKGLDLLSLPMSARNIASGPMMKDSPQSPSASSGSSSSTLPPYSAHSSPDAIEPDFNPRCRPDVHTLSGDTKLYHSTPKKSNFSERMMALMNRSIGNTNRSDENLCPSRDEGVPGITGTIDPSIEDEDGESTQSLPSLHERLLDVSMPITIFDFDETMPVSTSVGDSSSSLLSSTALSVTPKQGHQSNDANTAGRNSMPQMTSMSKIPSITEQKRQTLAFSNSPSGTLPLRPHSDRRHPSTLNNEFLSPLPAPPVPAKSSERSRSRSQPRLPVSRSVGFQSQPDFPAIRNLNREKVSNDAVINALKERLVEVKKERDEARRIVTEVRKALQNTGDGSLHILLS